MIIILNPNDLRVETHKHVEDLTISDFPVRMETFAQAHVVAYVYMTTVRDQPTYGVKILKNVFRAAIRNIVELESAIREDVQR